MDRFFVGVDAGYRRDRTDAAILIVMHLAQYDGPRFLIFETLAERTLAHAQLRKANDPGRGYAHNIVQLLAPILKTCLDEGIKVVSNLGAANPRAAAAIIKELANRLQLRAPKIAVVEGNDLLVTAGVNRTHPGDDDGFLAINNVDSGASSGDKSNGAT